VPKRPSPVPPTPVAPPTLSRGRLALAVAFLLLVPWSLAVLSQVQEAPTIDEVVHLPAGVSYWQKGTFKFYPHNPPLVKLIAAAPVVLAGPETDRMYAWPPSRPHWQEREPNKAALGHVFQEDNAARYFELFAGARLLMPTFGLIGGLAVFSWSRRLFGDLGGLLSLALWSFCPNVLAHTRLITTDVAATSLGCLATFQFWTYLNRPTWRRAIIAGLALGVAQLTKFSMLLLLGIWPMMAVIRLLLTREPSGLKALLRMGLQGWLIVFLAVLTINASYSFEEPGKPLGSFRFMSSPLAVWRDRPLRADPSEIQSNVLYARIREARVNRFADGPLAKLPVPLPAFYVSGFDEQKLEADGVWARFLDPTLADTPLDDPRGRRLAGYPVYLDGKLAQESWSHYYLMCLLYKVPEGTLALSIASLILLVGVRRSRAAWADELAVYLVPAVTFGAISLGTNINIGLRYVLPILPYVFIGIGRLVPWCVGLSTIWRRLAGGAIGLALVGTIAASLAAFPHYLAYFNWASGGRNRGAEHLIDSNLDWGQDLLGLHAWLRKHAPGEPVGIAYFGQINPDVFAVRGEPIDWYLPPARPGTMRNGPSPSQLPGRPGEDLRPGLYAISASLVRGLDWRVYDRSYTTTERGRGFAPFAADRNAFSYFQRVTPFDNIGGSIFLYRLDEDDVRRLGVQFAPLP
jgi:hypothetical protein